MQINYLGKNQVVIKGKTGTITTGEKVKINDIELPGTGEYEVAGIEAFGIAKEIFKFIVEDVNIGYFDSINRSLTQEEIQELNDISVMIIPVGGGKVLDPKVASEIVKTIEPSIVIPIEENDKLGEFCKLAGGCSTAEEKLTIIKSQIMTMEGLNIIPLTAK